MPLVLCPWGQSEYIHTCNINTVNGITSFFRVNSSRDDYIREDLQDYDCILLNPNWMVCQSVEFVQDQGPMVMTFREHYRRTSRMYLHTPGQPYHILPSKSGDQLCHEIVKTRTILPMRACKYSNMYQIHEQKGSFQGIDTYEITNL